MLQIAVIVGCPDVLIQDSTSDTSRRLLPRFSGARTGGDALSSAGQGCVAADRVKDFLSTDVPSINHLY
ncbi:hypothetical protein MTO96_037677 [Rhipicephalus appendiculatus]